MSIDNFLDRVEATGMIDPALMTELRKRVSESNRRMRPEMIAKLLVDRGELTAAQARKLVLDSAKDGSKDEDILTGEPAEPESTYNDDLDLVGDDLLDSDSDLGGIMGDDLELVDDTPEAILVEEDDDVPVAEADDDNLEAEGLRDLLDEPLVGGSDAGPDIDVDLEGQGTRIRRRGGFFSKLFSGRKKGAKTRWDSPLILLGGGGLILLVVAGLGFFALIHGESVDELYAKADEAYQSQSYGQAVELFESFSKKYPDNENASISRVRVELAKLRQHTDSSPNWSKALEQAKLGLPNVTSEAGLSDVRAELGKLLPDITNGLVETASSSEELDQKKQMLALADESLELVHNPVYLPTSIKQTQELRIEGIESNMDAIRRDIDRAEALAAATGQISADADAGRIVEAYRVRDDLVAKYPILLTNPVLNDALNNVADKERAAVVIADSQLKPVQADHPAVSSIQLVLCDRRGGAASGVDGQVYPVLARGAVYAVNASDGNVLWRRFVGYETSVFPQPVSVKLNSDLLLVDGLHSEVQRVDVKTGKLRWRLPCPSPISTPRIVGELAYVCCGAATESSLLAINLATGDVTKEAKFPVGCDTTPGVIGDGRQLVQVGVHSSVYVVDAATLECTSVIPTGHRRGSIVTPPAWIGGMLVVAENMGSRSARISAFGALEDGNWIAQGGPTPVTGRVVTEPLVEGRRIMVISDLGEVVVFEVPLQSAELRQIASVPAGDEPFGQAHAEFGGSQIWIADQKLTRFQLQATRGELVTEFIRNQRDIFQNPIRKIGNYIYTVRRRTGMLGVTVAAHSATDGKGDPVWETDLAVPSEIQVSSQNSVYAVTANGAMFPIDGAAVKAGVTDRRKARIDPRLIPAAFSDSIKTGSDSVAFTGPPPNTHMVLADVKSGDLNRVPLRIDADVASTELARFAGGAVLVACETGPIHCLDSRSGKAVTTPFVPRIEPGAQVDWLAPAALDGKQFFAAEQGGQLYLVGMQGKSLSMLKENQVDGPLVAGMASVGKTGFVVSSASGADELLAIKEDLSVTNSHSLKSGVAWGPKRVGNYVLVSDGSHTVSAFDDAGQTKWSVTLEGPLAGPPLEQNGRFVFATTGGQLAVVDGGSGQIAAKSQFGEPLGGGPVSYKGRLLIVGWDGTLYLVDVPK